jgi:hypothetical protein
MNRINSLKKLTHVVLQMTDSIVGFCAAVDNTCRLITKTSFHKSYYFLDIIHRRQIFFKFDGSIRIGNFLPYYLMTETEPVSEMSDLKNLRPWTVSKK